MTKVIDAVYENGVFKPLESVKMKDHEKVIIKVTPRKEWESRFEAVLKKIRKKTSKYSSAEIESDIAHAVSEARQAKRGCKSSY